MKRTNWIPGTAAVLLVIVMMAVGPRVFGVTWEATAASENEGTLASEVAKAPASEVQVKIDNFTFAPATITVPTGTSIRWVNRDEMIHNVVSSDKSFKSKVLDTNEEFTYTFSKAGTYTYFCSLHPRMTGKIVVE
jgi:plastocyanin